MVSYLDVVTILLVLFVALAAHLYSAPRKPMPSVSPATGPAPTTSSDRSKLAAVKDELEQSGLDVERDSRGVVVSLPQALLFGPGEDGINDNALAAVRAIAGILQKIPNDVTLVGHADATPIHNRRFNNNFELAAARGMRLLELLTSRYGIEESRLSVQSFGSYDSRSSNDTPDGRANNRRVEIVIHENSTRTSR
jgi:chemotaxis protein MotB